MVCSSSGPGRDQTWSYRVSSVALLQISLYQAQPLARLQKPHHGLCTCRSGEAGPRCQRALAGQTQVNATAWQTLLLQVRPTSTCNYSDRHRAKGQLSRSRPTLTSLTLSPGTSTEGLNLQKLWEKFIPQPDSSYNEGWEY